MQKTDDDRLILTKEEYETITSKAYFEGALVMLNKIEKVMEDDLQTLSNVLKRQFNAIREKLEVGGGNNNAAK